MLRDPGLAGRPATCAPGLSVHLCPWTVRPGQAAAQVQAAQAVKFFETLDDGLA